MNATEKEIATLNELYKGRKPFHGELHDHAKTGGTSDGKETLTQWREQMKRLHMDFAAILDHRQVRHMFLPEWEDGVFIGGSEPATLIEDIFGKEGLIHYNMITPGPEELMTVLEKYPEFEYTGGKEGHFIYPNFYKARFNKLIDDIRAVGGFFVHPHPKQMMVSDDPEDYWFQDETGIEVFYNTIECDHTKLNYDLWMQLLALGKRVWACAGGDGHARCSDATLTTIYAEEAKNRSYLSHLRVGDFACGPIGFRMAIGDTLMGGKCDFTGKRLVYSVSDFHQSVVYPDHEYSVVLLDNNGIVASKPITCDATAYGAFDIKDDRKFYRLEVFDVTRNVRIGIGNPIWNEK